MTASPPAYRPRWLRDLERFLPLKSQFVLSGNVRDLQLTATDSGAVPQPLVPHLVHELLRIGYADVVCYEPIRGFSVPSVGGDDSARADATLHSVGLAPVEGRASAGIDLFTQVLER